MRNRSFYRSLAAVLVIGLAFTGTARGATLQFIVFCDTLDPSIGTNRDLALCSNWAQIIANQTGLQLNLQTLSGQDLTPANARHLLNALSPAADDVVFFIYSGHGANPGDSPWPMFTLLTNLHDPVTFDEVVDILQPKTQRALFVFSDCCNVPLEAPTRLSPPTEPAGSPALTTANYQRLFVDFRGTILATASTVGQYSLSDPVFEGGLFLYTFVNDLNALAANLPDLTWDHVLDASAKDATRRAQDWLAGVEGFEPQQAYYVIDAEQVAPATPVQPDPANEEVADATPETPVAGNCGSMGALSLLAMTLGCCALKTRRKATV